MMADTNTQSLLEVTPLEVIENILAQCKSIEDILMFRQTCKLGMKSVMHFLRGEEGAQYMASKYIPNYNSINCNIKTLYKEQIRGLLALHLYSEENLFIQSPLGTGKTLLALMHAEDCWRRKGIRTIIVATPKCFTSWMDHIKLCNYNLVKSRPEKSDILVFHSKCKKHQNLIMTSSNEDIENLPYYIIITTLYYISSSHRAIKSRNRLLSLSSLYKQIILDESHLLNYNFGNLLNTFERKVYLSASPMQKDIRRGTSVVTMYDKYINLESKPNTLRRDHLCGAPVKMEYQLIPSKYDISLIINLLNNKDFKGKKVVLFTHWNPRDISSNVNTLRTNIPNFKFIRFHNTSEASLSKFRICDQKCVLVTTILSASEGTNFEVADSAIYIDFGKLVVERARQCFGRVKRRNNPNPVVQNYLIYDEGSAVSYIRTKLNLYHALDTKLRIERKNDGWIYNIYKVLQKNKVDIYKLPKPEFITIFGLNADKSSFLPFSEEDYTLPIFKVMQYMNIGY